MMRFLRDLAFLPEIWRHAVAQARVRRTRISRLPTTPSADAIEPDVRLDERFQPYAERNAARHKRRDERLTALIDSRLHEALIEQHAGQTVMGALASPTSAGAPEQGRVSHVTAFDLFRSQGFLP